MEEVWVGFEGAPEVLEALVLDAAGVPGRGGQPQQGHGLDPWGVRSFGTHSASLLRYSSSAVGPVRVFGSGGSCRTPFLSRAGGDAQLRGKIVEHWPAGRDGAPRTPV